MLQEQVYEEDLELNRYIEALILKSGCDCVYNESPVSFFTIKPMTISNGTVIVENIILKDLPAIQYSTLPDTG